MGSRQGEQISPVLFALFLNDLQSSIKSLGCTGVELRDDMNDSDWL